MRLGWISVLLFWACAATAQSEESISILVKAIEDVGCIVTEANEQGVLLASGMTEEEAKQIVLVLMNTGRAVPLDDDLKLMTGKCS